jgi:hypothetical protein
MSSTYNMDFEYTGECAKERNPGPCVGDSAEQCPGGCLGVDTFSGQPVTCLGSNSGVRRTFV